MIRIDVEQGSPEWTAARLGTPTASQFKNIITMSGAPSKAAHGYMCELIAEKMIGASLDPFVSEWMERGTELEHQAVNYYEMQREVDTEKIGHCMTDDRLAGCSPDRLIGDDGGLEIKCPSAKLHVSYLISPPEKFRQQVQGGLWVTERKWWDFLSFHPELPPVMRRFERDEEYIERMAVLVRTFCETMKEAIEQIGWKETPTGIP